MSWCRKRYASSLVKTVERCGRISSFRTSAASAAGSPSERQRRARGQNSLPDDGRRVRAAFVRRAPAGRGALRGARGSSVARRRRSPRRPRPAARASARRRADCPRPWPRRASRTEASSSVSTSRFVDQRVGLVFRQRLEQERRGVVLAAAPARARVERSGRARQRSRMDASRLRSATCSTRSRKVGSAQCMSSSTTTSGRWRGERLEELAHGTARLFRTRATPSANADAGEHVVHDPPRVRLALEELNDVRRAAEVAQDLESGQYVIPSPYERQRPCTTSRLVTDTWRRTPARGVTCRSRALRGA